MKKVLLAIGEENYSNIIRRNLIEKGQELQVLDQEVYHLDYLEETLEELRPDILIMHDSYLPNSFDDDSKRESYLVELFRSFREIYDDRLRVVYLCERDTSDPFLADIVSANVLDIFNTRSFKLIDFVEQINQPPKFSNVKKFTEVVTRETASAVADESKTEEEAGIQEKQQEEQKPKEIIKEVIKEKVVVRDRIVQTSSMLVGVVNLTVKAGSSFLTTLMAKSLAEHDVSVSVFDVPINQPGKSYIFDLLGFHLHFKEDYYPLHQEYKEKEDITKHTIPKQLYEKINWHVFNPHYLTLKDWQHEDVLDLAHFFSETVTLIDLGYFDLNKESLRVLRHFDHIYFVSNSAPQEIEANKDRIEFFITHGKQLNGHLVLNQFSDLLKKRGIENVFEGHDIFQFPMIDYGEVLSQLFKGKIPYDTLMNDEQATKVMRELLKLLIPDLSFSKKSKGLFGKFMKRH